MKIIDRKGRLFEKVSIIDLTIVIVVALVAIFLYNFIFGGSTVMEVEDQKETITYTVEFQKVNQAFGQMPMPGGPVYNSSKSYFIGTIVASESMPYVAAVENYGAGSFELAEHQGLYTVLLTIEAKADVDPYGFMVGRQIIKVGERVPVKGKGFASYGYIVAIDREGQVD